MLPISHLSQTDPTWDYFSTFGAYQFEDNGREGVLQVPFSDGLLKGDCEEKLAFLKRINKANC